MSACICTTYLPDIWWKSEEGVTLELELWMVVNHLVGAGNWTCVLWKRSRDHNHWATPLVPCLSFSTTEMIGVRVLHLALFEFLSFMVLEIDWTLSSYTGDKASLPGLVYTFITDKLTCLMDKQVLCRGQGSEGGPGIRSHLSGFQRKDWHGLAPLSPHRGERTGASSAGQPWVLTSPALLPEPSSIEELGFESDQLWKPSLSPVC